MATEECVRVTVIDTLIKFNTLGGLVFLAFLLALLLGLIIGALIMRCIFREIEEHNTRRKNKSFLIPLIEEDKIQGSPSVMVKMGSNRIGPMPGQEDAGTSVAIEMDPMHHRHSQSGTPSWGGPSHRDGMSVVEALTKQTGEEMEVELQTQDFKCLEKMEKNLRQEKNETFLQLLKMVLTFLLSKSRIDEEFKRRTLAKYEQIIEDVESNAMRDQAVEAQELRETITNQTELDNALETLHSKYSKRMSSELTELQEEVGKDLVKDSGLTEEESEQIVAKLMANVSATERRLADEANRQSMVLHERLAKRQAMAQQRVIEKQEEKEEFEERRKKPPQNLEILRKRGKLLEDQSNRILEEYEKDLKVLEEKQQQGALRHEAELAEKLKRKREQKMKRLQNEQEGEKEDFEARANQMISEGTMTAEDYLESFHRLKVEQQVTREEEDDRSDEQEAQELDDLHQQLSERWDRALGKRDNELFQEIKNQAHLTSKEAERLVKKHEEDLEEYASRKSRERERQQAMIQEKLAERRKRWEREAQQRAVEQDQMMTQQEQTLKQVLNTQIGLTEELRKQVMLEHEQNLMVLNNHLQISRMRQQKKLEHRLAQRRARLSELRKNMEEERAKQAKDDPDRMKILARSQNIEYQAEVKKMEDEHQAALEDLRRRLATETDDSLKEQDERLGKILGKLQLEVARREEIIKRQDEAIRTLEKKFVETMTRDGTLADAQTDRIMKQHQKQMERLNENVGMEKEKQMQRIREKIEAKKLKKERELEVKQEKEAEEMKSKGVKTASSAMALILSEQQHKREMEELEKDMQIELRRQKELLSKEMAEQLVVELQEEEERFLATVADASNIPEDELMMAIKTSASQAGMDAKLTKTIAKDVRKRLRSAKSRTTET